MAVGLSRLDLTLCHCQMWHGLRAWIWHTNETPYIWYQAILGEGVNPPEPGRGKYLNNLCVV